jgi:hypothetical protein
MFNRTRIILAFQRQIVFGVAYLCHKIWIGFLCFNIEIDCTNHEMDFFRFENRFKM